MSDPALPSTPFKGLNPYAEKDADYFFGREVECEVITANLLASRLTLLYGASGVGKSSVLRAGVAHYLRGIAKQNLAEQSSPEFAIAVFSSWRGDPIAGLIERVQASVAQALNLTVLDPVPSNQSLLETMQTLAMRVGGDLFIILDQFEEYFLYHGDEDGEGSFAVEFPRAVNRPDLRVNFLVSIREDALAKMDRFKGRIPGLFKNYLRIDHLNREAARRAINKPIARFNDVHRPDAQPVTIEPDLVEAVLGQLSELGQDVLGQVGRGFVGTTESVRLTGARIVAPYLQMVLTRLWEEEMRAGVRVLRLETLDRRLGGAKQIVRTHVDQVLESLGDDEREVAARLFRYLVTPSGTKIAHSLADLALYAELPRERVQPVLTRLAAPEVRVLREFTGYGNEAEHFEIFHDVLARPVLDWRARYLQAEERAEAEKRAALEAAKREQEIADQQVQDMQRVLARCSGLSEALRSIKRTARPDARPFDIIVLGGGTFGAIVAQHLFDRDRKHSHRVLVLEGGPVVMPDHIQNLLMLGFKLPPPTSIKQLKRIKQYGLAKSREGVWGLPWHSKVAFPGLAYCIGGRSLFWGGWAPRPLDSEMLGWPKTVVEDLNDQDFKEAAKQIGCNSSKGFIHGPLHDALRGYLFEGINTGAVNDAIPLTNLSELEAPLAVQADAGSGFVRKFSTAPLLLSAARFAWVESGDDDVKRRLMVVPNCHIMRLTRTEDRVTAVETNKGKVPVPLGGVVIIALGTIESTRLALQSLRGTASESNIGQNLMTHLRSKLVIRIPRSALPVSPHTGGSQAAALFVKGRHANEDGTWGHFHLQISAAGSRALDMDSEINLFQKLPDIDSFEALRAASGTHIVIEIRAIGEMESHNSQSYVRLDPDRDEFGVRRAFVAINASKKDRMLWDAMDSAADQVALIFAGSHPYEVFGSGRWLGVPPGLRPSGVLAVEQRRCGLGATHQEAGTLWMGTDPAHSVTDTNGRFHGIENAYVVGPALFPTMGSANPMLTAVALARRLARHLAADPIVSAPERCL